MENFTTSGLRTPDLQKIWYCGRVLSGRERLFERTLRRFGIETYFPMCVKFIPFKHEDDRGRVLRQGVREHRSPLFPGYVFAALDDYGWVRTRSVEIDRKPRWLDFGSGPVQIPVELIEDIRAREEHGFVTLLEEEELTEGEEVEVLSGAFVGRRGLLASDPERRTVTLHLIAESYALQPTQVLTKLKIDREQVRRVFQ